MWPQVSSAWWWEWSLLFGSLMISFKGLWTKILDSDQNLNAFTVSDSGSWTLQQVIRVSLIWRFAQKLSIRNNRGVSVGLVLVYLKQISSSIQRQTSRINFHLCSRRCGLSQPDNELSEGAETSLFRCWWRQEMMLFPPSSLSRRHQTVKV